MSKAQSVSWASYCASVTRRTRTARPLHGQDHAPRREFERKCAMPAIPLSYSDVQAKSAVGPVCTMLCSRHLIQRAANITPGCPGLFLARGMTGAPDVRVGAT